MNEITGAKGMVLESREVAGMVGKDHSNLLKDIQRYVGYLEKSKVTDGLNAKVEDFFAESSYKPEEGGRTYKCYNVTKKGCEFIAHKLTGQKGAVFTANYINRFHELEKNQVPQLSPMQMMELQFQVVKEHDSRLDKLENDMPLFTVECKELQSEVRKTGIEMLGGYRSPAYNDRSLRGRVYSDIQGQLKREFGVTRYEAIRRVQLDQAMEMLGRYRVPLVLEEEIRMANGQIAI